MSLLFWPQFNNESVNMVICECFEKSQVSVYWLRARERHTAGNTYYFFLRTHDSGPLSFKDHLPVTEISFGDINRVDSEAAYRVGHLKCYGDSK